MTLYEKISNLPETLNNYRIDSIKEAMLNMLNTPKQVDTKSSTRISIYWFIEGHAYTPALLSSVNTIEANNDRPQISPTAFTNLIQMIKKLDYKSVEEIKERLSKSSLNIIILELNNISIAAQLNKDGELGLIQGTNLLYEDKISKDTIATIKTKLNDKKEHFFIQQEF